VTANHFDHFEPILRKSGSSAVRHPDTLLRKEPRHGKEPRHEIFYIPFEHVNRHARMVIVGITPGTNQLKMAYAEAQRLLRLGKSREEVLEAVKKLAAFGGDAMKPNLLRMLRHFNFARILGISDEADLWGGASALLHATSVVPNAAFKNGKMFSGSFDEIIKVGVLRQQFEEDFVPTLTQMAENALFIALGKTPCDALKHCVELGVIKENQLLGALAHPSRKGGSQVAFYLGEKTLDELDPADPVRGRAKWLTEAYAEMRSNTDRLTGTKAVLALPPQVQASKPAGPSPSAKAPMGKKPGAIPVVASASPSPIGRGRLIGEVTINEANLRYKHFYLRPLIDEFPIDVIGGSNKMAKAPSTVLIDWGGPDPVRTDIDGKDKKFFRARGWVGAFYKLNHAKPGDRVVIHETAPYRYRVRLKTPGREQWSSTKVKRPDT
jgi:hypothetical protein